MNCITGDTHGDTKDLLWRIKQCHKNGGKHLFIAGDFGFIWESNKKSTIKEDMRLNVISKEAYTKDVKLLFIDGNHENFNRLLNYPEINMFGGKIGVIRDNILHLKRGYVYNIDNKKIFTMGGGVSVDKSDRIENVSWWSQELHSKEEQDRALINLENNSWEVDYVITHSAPTQAEAMIWKAMKMEGIYSHWKMDVFNPEAKFHTLVCDKLQFKDWHFGHYHQDYFEGKFHLHYSFVKELF